MESKEPLQGKKTYIVAVAMIAFALLGNFLGYLDAAKSGEILLEGLGLVMLRLGIKKIEL